MSWKDTYNLWRSSPSLDPQLKEELEQLSDEVLEDSFGADLSFGTAGMRGVLGPGTNRMNIYTIRQATEGLAQLIEAAGEEAKKRGVAIAYDSRHFSASFAMEAALVLGAHDIKTYVYESLRPTPVLSFAVRHLKTYAGIMITASHNPAEYNGYKVYGEDGGQMPPEDADRLTEYVRAVENSLEVKVGDKTELLGSGLIEIIGDRIDQAYLAEMKKVTVNPDLVAEMADKVNIVFSPLHGTGLYIGMKALEQAGFKDVHVVKSQAEADGDFPTVSSPNPESAEAFVEAEELGRTVNADILVATDPDADRLGAMIRTADGSYELLTGNQIASIMIDYILNAHQENGTLPENSVVVKSLVSTNLADAIVESYGSEMVEVLTGFKFIAEKIKEYEETNSHTFMMGFEESYGYLVEPFVRDKDAIQALVVLAELTAYHKKAGRTLGDALEAIYEEHGYFVERTISVSFPGLSGQEKMAQIMNDVRASDLKELEGIAVTQTADYLTGILSHQDGRELKLQFPSSDALKFVLEDNSWIAFRPSGTEPKIKLYLGVSGKDLAEANAKADTIEKFMRSLTD